MPRAAASPAPMHASFPESVFLCLSPIRLLSSHPITSHHNDNTTMVCTAAHSHGCVIDHERGRPPQQSLQAGAQAVRVLRRPRLAEEGRRRL